MATLVSGAEDYKGRGEYHVGHIVMMSENRDSATINTSYKHLGTTEEGVPMEHIVGT